MTTSKHTLHSKDHIKAYITFQGPHKSMHYIPTITSKTTIILSHPKLSLVWSASISASCLWLVGQLTTLLVTTRESVQPWQQNSVVQGLLSLELHINTYNKNSQTLHTHPHTQTHTHTHTLTTPLLYSNHSLVSEYLRNSLENVGAPGLGRFATWLVISNFAMWWVNTFLTMAEMYSGLSLSPASNDSDMILTRLLKMKYTSALGRLEFLNRCSNFKQAAT